jgi:hypothetical protein
LRLRLAYPALCPTGRLRAPKRRGAAAAARPRSSPRTPRSVAKRLLTGERFASEARSPCPLPYGQASRSQRERGGGKTSEFSQNSEVCAKRLFTRARFAAEAPSPCPPPMQAGFALQVGEGRLWRSQDPTLCRSCEKKGTALFSLPLPSTDGIEYFHIRKNTENLTIPFLISVILISVIPIGIIIF